LQLMKDSACRIGEAVDYFRWQVTTNYVKLQPQKKNNRRILDIEDFTEISINYLVSQQNHYPEKFYNKFQYFIKESIKTQYYIGEKRLTTHIFRHLRVKEMVFRHGATEQQIQDYLGEKTITAVRYYTQAIIYKK
jgi:integrase